MKLIEKLAMEELIRQQPWTLADVTIVNPMIESAFEAGFRAARDLMCERFDWVEAGNQYTNMCQVGEEEIDLAPDPGTAPGT